MVNLGDEFPNFSADSTIGPMKFHEYIGNGLVVWVILPIRKILWFLRLIYAKHSSNYNI